MPNKELRIRAHDEILAFIEHKKLMGIGTGLIDVHLLESSLLINLPENVFSNAGSLPATKPLRSRRIRQLLCHLQQLQGPASARWSASTFHQALNCPI